MKTYCISDIHGHYDNLKNFINTLDEDDKVYVLGDVIDKGEDPIKCLITIIKDSRFEMLLGNHEYMMYQYLSSIDGTKERKEAYDHWVNWNCGEDTLNPYNRLSIDDQSIIMSFIKNLPLNIVDLSVNGKHFYLVHSNPASDKQVNMNDLNFDEEKISDYVWERTTPGDKINSFGKILITGHTPIQVYTHSMLEEVKPMADTESLDTASYIDIDGGLAASWPNSKLIALCLDDMTYKLY